MTSFTLHDLDRIVCERSLATPDTSYTAKLLAGGLPKTAKKFGEEAVEAVIAAAIGDREHLKSEAADVLFHFLVMLRSADLPLDEVLAELERRTVRSGIAEKASRRI